MDRDEALRLLRGGNEGVREWNQRRESGEEIPDLSRADLSRADLSHANLVGIDLSHAKLICTDLSGADLSGAKLDVTNLDRANLNSAHLRGTDLRATYLRGAQLRDADLRGADLTSAKLQGADFRGADLTKARLIRTIMVEVNLKGAKLNDCRIYGISVWKAQTDKNTEQNNLILSDYSDSVLTIDNLKVAQFIHLLVNNEEIRGVIDTITSKVVLILGRFKSDRKAVLDTLRAVLRERGYSPILFDFDKPHSRDLTETISTLAHMARFIIADITDAKSIPQELQAIVPNLPSVPVQPIIHESDRPYGMFEHFKRYPWVLSEYYYNDQSQLIQSLPSAVIGPAEAKVAELRGKGLA